MSAYTVKKEVSSERVIVVDDMILTKDLPTTAGSQMLDGYMSLLESEALTRLTSAGYELGGKAKAGEFAIDLLGETSYQGAISVDGILKNASAEIIVAGEAVAALCMDVNGTPRRAAAQSGLVSLKPTYGTVSRYGTIPVACSGETVSLLAADAKTCRDLLEVIVGHDDKDGTSLPDALCAKVKKGAESAPLRRVAVANAMKKGIDETVASALGLAIETLKKEGVEVVEIEGEILSASRAAWNVLMSAELCNNVSRYDGVKYGYRAENFSGIDELYTNSRTEAFGDLLKYTILFGSETLSTENYMKVYDKCLRTRRVIAEEFSKIFCEFDAVLLPACSAMAYAETEQRDASFVENYYTAPASITGLPAVVAGGVQLIGKAFSEQMLLNAAEVLEREGR